MKKEIKQEFDNTLKKSCCIGKENFEKIFVKKIWKSIDNKEKIGYTLSCVKQEIF